jgi:hypothetical protein
MSHHRSNAQLVSALIAAGLLTSFDAAAQSADTHATAKGLPLAERGSLSLETSTALFTTKNAGTGAVLLDVVTGIPLTDRVIADVRLPITSVSVGGALRGVTSVGNVMVGAHYVMNLDSHTWLTLGGALGIPLNPRDFVGAITSSAGAYWNLHEVYPGVVPIYARGALENHFDSIVLRMEAEPVFYAPYTDGIGDVFTGFRDVKAQFSIQHAVEVQFGGSFGGGLRLQGFLFPTNDGPFGTGDLYQLAMEPFVFVEKSILFARLGVMLPLDEELGPPAKNLVGIRFAAGLRFD